MVEKVAVKEGTFIEDLEGGRLLGSKCKSCGQIFFPKSSLCFSCFSEDTEEIVLSRKGKLYTFTIGRMASMNFQPPYAIGLIEMPEGIRIMAPLKWSEGDPLKVGMEMEVVIEKLWQEKDKEIIGYKFKPV